MKVVLHEGQLKIANDTHRYRIICAGRRWGKSVLSRLIILKWAVENKGLYWIVSPTYRQGKQNHWRSLKSEIPKSWIEKTNEVELSIQLKNGSIIELKGAENPDNLRGVKLRGLVIDEIASIRNWDWLWSEVLRATLTDYSSPALFISTPKGYNHFYNLYQQGQETNSDYRSWRFTSYDNPYIPKGEIDNAKNELTEDTFAQEYLADFRKFTGLAHKPWDRFIHLISPFSIPDNWQYARGFDFGSTDGTASVRAVFDNDWDCFIERCYLDNHKTIKEHAETIKSEDYGKSFMPAWGDPSGGQWFNDFKFFNVNIEQASKSIPDKRGYVEYCVEKVNERLLPQIGRTLFLPDGRRIDNAPHMYVFDTHENQNFVKQIENLKWRETSAGVVLPVLDETGDPTGFHFDLLAALRYLLVSWSPLPDIPKNDFSAWQI